MDITEPPQKKEFENVLPLVNIVFLLLIFFMLAGAFVKPDAIMVEAPMSSIGLSSKESPLIILMNKDQQFAIEKTLYDKEGIIQFIQQKLAENQQTTVQLKADGLTPSKDILDIMSELGQVGLPSIQLLTINNQ